MGKTALAAADTFTLREWAARLATRAPPRDYVEQLHELYDGIIERWRYVLERGEWVHGTPKSLLGRVLGANYNRDPVTCPDATHCDVEATDWKEKGWGDCDDVATLAAAGALSLGMPQVYWRVSRAPGGAHVSVTVVTPRGEVVELDPVGHPDKPFNWAATGANIQVTHFDMQGQQVPSPSGGRGIGVVGPLGSEAVMTAHAQPQYWPAYMGHLQQQAQMYAGHPEAGCPTYLGGPQEIAERPHICTVAANDFRGARVLAVPEYHARMMRRGGMIDRTPAVDQFGDSWEYQASSDLWVPQGHGYRTAANLSAMYYPGYMQGDGFFGRRRRRRGKRRGRFRRFLKKIGKGIRKIHTKIVGSKLVQGLVSTALLAFGIPRRVTKMLMRASATISKRGGIRKLLKMVRKNPKKALKMLARDVMKAGKGGLLKKLKIPGFKGGMWDDVGVMEISGPTGDFYGAPVIAIAGLPGAYEFGQLDVTGEPEPGAWYRVRKGDTLLGIAKRALGKPGIRHGNWISKAAANAHYLVATKSAFAQKYFGPDIVGLYPRWSADATEAIDGVSGGSYPLLWIPGAEGDEPPLTVPDIPDISPGPVRVPEEEYEEDEEGTPWEPDLIPGEACLSLGPGPHGTGYIMDPAGTGQCIPAPGPIVVPPEPPIEEEGEGVVLPPPPEEEDYGPYEPPIEETEPPDEAGEPPAPEPTPEEEEYEEPEQVCTPRLDANGNWIPFVWDDREGTCIPTRPFTPPGAQPPPGPRPPFAPQPVPFPTPYPPVQPGAPGAPGGAPIIPLMLAAYLLL